MPAGAGIWAEVLGCERVGLEADFFALGGHSLLATQLVSRVRHAFAVELPLRRLFETPTLAGLARAVVELRQAARGLELPPPQPLPRDGDLPLSFAQQRLWFIDQMDPGNPAYNLALPVRLLGRLNLAALAGSLDAVRRRHEVLRTTFATRDGKPVQVIASESAEVMAVVDLRALPEAAREPEALRLAQDDAARSFDLGRGPLLRTAVVRLAEDDHVFLLSMHHVVTDGWSMDVFLRELVTLYGAAVRGEPSPLPELGIQYADFAGWQRQWLEEKVFAAQLEVWKRRLRPPLAIVEVAADRPRPALRTYRGSTRGISLPDPLTTGLRELARCRGATGFMVSLAAFLVLLRRITGEKDLPVGTPIANRNLAEIEGLIGFFVNTLVMRGDLSGDPDFHELLDRVREVALEAYENQDLPFELLVEALDPDRDLSRPPLFQVMFVHQALSRLPAPSDSELSVSTLALAGSVAKFDLTLFVGESGDGLSAALEYNTDLFDATTAARLLDHYRRLLDGVVAAPERRISELAMLAPGERHQLLGEWNDTARRYPQERCLHQFFEAQAAATPEAVAVVLDEERISYRELDRRANHLAHHLRALGVGAAEDVVAICVERSLEMVVGLLGILKAGGPYLPLDPTYPEERLAFMLEDSRARILLTHSSLTGRVGARAGVEIVPLDAVGLRSTENPAGDIVPESPAYVLYTSGSTGRPKGVVVSHRAVCNHILWMLEALPLKPDDRVLQKTPFSFDASVWEFWAPLFAGAQVILARPEEHRDPAALTATLRRQRVTILHLVPSLLRLLIEQPRFVECCDLTRVLSGGEPLTGELRDRYFATGLSADLFNLYGPTEATINATLGTSSRSDARSAVPIGRPITNVELYVLDEQLRPLPLGAVGKLYLGGAGLARGYLHQPQQSAERFAPHPLSPVPGSRLYDTGDLARYLADGNVEFLGRGDHQVKVRGFRIELGEIATVLAAYPGIRESVVVVRDALPRLPNGKVDRAALARRAPDRPQPELIGEYVAPRTALEEVLVGMWAELLRVDEVGVHANFFELGGHSLLATQLLSWVRDSFDAEVPLRLVFEQPTVAGLAAALLADPAERPRVEKTAELLLELSEVEE